MKNLTRLIPLLLAFCLMLTGCGGGSGSSTANKKTTVTTKVMTSGLLTNYSSHPLIITLDLAISVPNGVTVKIDPLTNNPASDVVRLVGNFDPGMTLSAVDFPPAETATANRYLNISYINANSGGFTPAESLLVQLEIPIGISLKADDFVLTKFNYDTIDSRKITNSISLNAEERAKLFQVEIL